MSNYFHVKVSFLRQQNDGTIKKESEQYLVDAMSFTETEARVIKEVGESVRDLYFDSIAHSPIQEVVSYGDTDLWFKCKVVYKDVDPDSGKEKKTTLYILVNANDVNEAYDRCKDHLKSMLVPFEIPKVEETAICEIYQYEKPVPAGYIKRVESPSFVNQLQKDEGALDAEWNRVNGASNLAEYLTELVPEISIEKIEDIRKLVSEYGNFSVLPLREGGFKPGEARKIMELCAKEE
mgnify:CR=1 FL=1